MTFLPVLSFETRMASLPNHSPYACERQVIDFVRRQKYNGNMEMIEQEFAVLSGLLQFLPAGDLYQTLLPVGLALGIGIGFLGSGITIRKHLKV